MYKKILIINLRHIGDALLITPLIANLKYAYPNTSIDILVNAECGALFENHPDICTVLAYNKRGFKKFNIIKRTILEIKFALNVRNYDLIIATTEGERSAFLSFLSGAKTKVGIRPPRGIFASFIKPYTTEYTHKELIRHTVERNLDALRALHLPIVSKKVELFFSDDDLQHIAKILPIKDFIHIHAASRWGFKCLPSTIIAQVIDSLPLPVVLTGASSDVEFNNEIATLCKTKPIDLSSKLSLTQMAALSKSAKLFFGVDSAPMHIAASQNTPCVAVFGPSGVFNWGAWDNDLFECGYNVKNGIQTMGKHTMLQVSWNCAPCGQAGCNNSRTSNCLLEIKADDIINICLSKL